MATAPNNLSRFWQELKRRNVVRVVTVYAGAAFVILELVDIIAEPLKLPSWLLPVVIVLLFIGFIIAVILSWIYDIHPEGGMVKTETVNELKAKEIPKSSNTWKIASYISFVVIIGLIVLNLFGKKNMTGIDESLAKSIAVLPFHNYSGDPGQDYMCEGLTDEIISHLFKLKSFDEVRSLTSVIPFKDSEKSTTQIAEGLNVNYILEGSYKRMGDDLKITAQLIEAMNDNHIWLQDYELPYAEIIGIPGEIAYQIADHLKAFMTEEEQQDISSFPTKNLEAYELVQQVKSMFNAKPFVDRTTIIDLSEKAIALDPDYADPYAWKGTMILADGFFWGNKEMKTIAWEAEKFLDKALRIDPENFMAHWGMVCIDFFVKWDYVHMVEILEKFGDQWSSDLNISWANALFWLKMGLFEEALASNGPEGRPDINFYSQILLGNTDYVRDEIEKAIDSNGYFNYASAADIYIWLQEFDRAIVAFDSMIATVQAPVGWMPKFHAALAVANFKTGRIDLARTMIGKLIERSETTSVGSPAFFTGWYYSWIGELDSAFYWLDKAVENRSTEVSWLKVDPAFNSLKEDPRYWDLYERTGHKAFDDYMKGNKH